MTDQSQLQPRWRAIAFRGYVVISIALIGSLALAEFSKADRKPRFQEIDVERINIIEPNGLRRMTISNAARAPGWVFRGKVFPGRPKSAGIIFFNDEGEEDGGLLFGGRKVNGKVEADGGLAFDHFDSDEAIKLSFSDESGRRWQGLTVTDRADIPIVEWATKMDSIEALPNGPEKDSARRALQENHGDPLVARRLFVGRDASKAAVVNLADRFGHPRLRMVVDSSGDARIEFLNGKGRVMRTIKGTDASASSPHSPANGGGPRK